MKKLPKWQIITAAILIIVITGSTIAIQIAQVKLSADNYENILQNKAAQYLMGANDYVGQGMFDRALDQINLYFDLYSETEEGYLTRASIYTGSGDYNNALADMNEVIALNSEESDYFLQRGCLYILLNDYDNAQLDFNQVVAMDKEDPYALLLIAQIYYEKEQYQLALDTYETYLLYNPPSADIYAQEAYLYSLLLKYETATEKLKKAYGLNPTTEYASALAQSYAAIQKYDDAIRFANIVLKDTPQDTTIIKLRADTYYLTDEFEKALTDYTAFLKIQPKDETCAYQQCICYLQLEEYDKLLTSAKELLTYATDKDIIKNTEDIVSYLSEE